MLNMSPDRKVIQPEVAGWKNNQLVNEDAELSTDQPEGETGVPVGEGTEEKPQDRIRYTEMMDPLRGTSEFVARAATGEQVEIHLMDGANLDQVIDELSATIQKMQALRVERIRQEIGIAEQPAEDAKAKGGEFDVEAVQKELEELLGSLRELQREKEMVEIDSQSFADTPRLHEMVRTEGRNTFYFMVTKEALEKIENRLPGNYLESIDGDEGKEIGSRFLFRNKDLILNLIFITQYEKEQLDDRAKEADRRKAVKREGAQPEAAPEEKMASGF